MKTGKISETAHRLDKLERKLSELLAEKEYQQRCYDLYHLESTIGNEDWLAALSPEQQKELLDKVMMPANEWLLKRAGLHVQLVTYQTMEHR